MHGGAAGSGAPRENRNAWKSGRFTREAIDERSQVWVLLNEARRLLEKLR
jgi:glucans biosynthesis protein